MIKIKRIFQRSPRDFRIAGLVVIAVILAMAAIAPWRKHEQEVVEQPLPPQETLVRRAIDGIFVPEDKMYPYIAGVMIENMIEAQPLSGIADARLVFEAVTEANITRFLAYFILDQEPAVPEIGPVRSARPYYLNFATPFNTVFAHVGSSPAAYNLLRKEGVRGIDDLDQWYKSEYFFPKQGRSKPHHIYTTTELLKKYASSDREATISPWKFKNDISPNLRGDVNDIRINYITPYNVQWLYDKSENYYKRMQWNGPHKDAQDKEIIAKNIAVAFMKMKVLDDVGRKEFTTIGEGKGLVFQDGRVVVGTWKKATAGEMLRWYDSQGNEVEFNAGVTWVEIVPEGYEIKY